MPTFRNTTGLTITDATGNQTGFRPVSQTVAVSGVGVVNSVAVTLTGFTHATPVDLDFVLVAPDGSNLVFLSDAGWYLQATNQTLTFADAGAAQAPSASVLVDGTTYKPTNQAIGLNETPAQFGLPGGATLRNPGGSDSFANAFNGIAGDGVWTLYAVDDANGDTGTISGWILTINGPDVIAAPAPPPPASPPTAAPIVAANFSNVVGDPGFGFSAVPSTVTTPTGEVVPNPLLEQRKGVAALIAKVDAGQLTLRQAQDQIVDMADGTTSVASMSYQFFTGRLPTKAGLDYLVSSPQNPADLNDGYYAGMSLENRYINFAVNLGKLGEGASAFAQGYGSLSLADAATKAYTEIFGASAPGKIAAILTPERSAYFLSLGGDAIGQKAAMVGFLLGEAAKSDLGPYAARNENFLYDLLDGTAAFGADAHIYENAGPSTVGLVGVG